MSKVRLTGDASSTVMMGIVLTAVMAVIVYSIYFHLTHHCVEWRWEWRNDCDTSTSNHGKNTHTSTICRERQVKVCSQYEED
jgi:hypothetical protein